MSVHEPDVATFKGYGQYSATDICSRKEDDMKLFDSIGPNPKVVRMFMAERGIQLDTEKVDILAGDNRKDAYLRRNPSGTLPCLELDDGSFLAEILPVCEYLEEWAGASSLIGETLRNVLKPVCGRGALISASVNPWRMVFAIARESRCSRRVCG